MSVFTLADITHGASHASIVLWFRRFGRDPAVSAHLMLMLAGGLAGGLTLAATGVSSREIAADAWFQRDFDSNYHLCAVHDNRPDWCKAWLDAMESARPKTTSLSVPEWRRLTFADNMMVCAALLPPDWCPAWHAAMKAVTQDTAYADLVNAPAAERIKEEDERQARAEAWQRFDIRAMLAAYERLWATPNGRKKRP